MLRASSVGVCWRNIHCALNTQHIFFPTEFVHFFSFGLGESPFDTFTKCIRDRHVRSLARARPLPSWMNPRETHWIGQTHRAILKVKLGEKCVCLRQGKVKCHLLINSCSAYISSPYAHIAHTQTDDRDALLFLHAQTLETLNEQFLIPKYTHTIVLFSRINFTN